MPPALALALTLLAAPPAAAPQPAAPPPTLDARPLPGQPNLLSLGVPAVPAALAARLEQHRVRAVQGLERQLLGHAAAGAGGGRP